VSPAVEPVVSITNPSAVCAPATVNITAASVTTGSTAGLTYTYWTNAAATASLSNAAALSVSGTYYIKGTNASGCSIVQPVSVTLNSKPTVVITNPTAACSPATVSLTNAAVTAGSTTGLSYSYWTNAAATIAYGTPAAAVAGTYYVRGTAASGCSDIQPVTVSINTSPTLAVTNPAPVCSPATVDITAPVLRTGSTAGLTVTYWSNATATIAYATPAAATNGTYYMKGTDANGCTDTEPVVVTVNTTGATPNFNPSTSGICMGTIQPLSAGTTFSSVSTAFSSSATLNAAITDNNVNGVNHTLAVSGIPAGAVISNIRVNFNIAHAKAGDLIINLRAPNNKVLNLVNREGNLGANFTNTNISANATSTIAGVTAPFTGTYLPEATVGIDGARSVTPFIANAASFNELYTIPNGNWTISVRDAVFGTGGTLSNWSINISYNLPAAPQNYVWTPTTALYTDAAATVPYTGQALTTVYAKPATSGTLTYTATATSAATCNGTGNISITVNPVPAVSLTANYCGVPGKVTLTATSVPAGATFTWNTGQTGASIDVDIADTYVVTAALPSGCSGTASISVAEELVINGDFTAGNTGFITDYAFKADIAGVNNELVPDTGADGYGVGTNGQDYHTNFWGLDHTNNTTGARNFMLVNGKGGTLKIWKTTVDVLPSTTYYFSAWGMSLNAAGPFARLQFNVNGAQVGTVANLASGVNSNANNGWTRFYGTWTSGPTSTSAEIEITNLEPSLPGNDFGLDDISFGTLSTFITLASTPSTTSQTLCMGSPITPIEYDLGSGGAPVVSGLPAGLTSTFNGINLVISGTPTLRGNYPVTITTTGCNPVTSTAILSINGPTIALQSGNSTTNACRGTAITPLEYSIGGTATGALISSGSLPAGVSGSFAGNVFAISGTPTVSGTFNFTIRTTGTCGIDSLSATITVRDQSISLTSATASPSVCINTTLSPSIVYTIGGTGTGATVSGLPSGISGSFSSGLFVISGTPTVPGSFNYTVTTSGTCAANTANGTITINTAPTVTLSSAAGTNNQTVCVNNSISIITYNTPNASSASITAGALPAGVTGVFNAGVFSISGTPTANGTFNYTVTATGTCGTTNTNGSINVPVQTIALTSGSASPSLCINTLMPAIVYTFSGAATAASASGLPAGVSTSISGNQLTISGTPTASGTFNYTITTSGTCTPATRTGSITVNPATGGGNIASVSICRGGSGSLTITGQSGTIQQWSVSTNGGTTWGNIANTTITQSFTAVSVPTQYRATVNNGCGNAFSTVATVRIKNYWTGSVSNDFSNPANWSEGIMPSSSCPDLIIPAGAVNMPVLSAGTISTINLVIEPAASFTLSGGTLRISGNIVNNGTFNARNGNVELNGSAAQNISGSMFSANTINNLVVSNTAGINISNTAGNLLRIGGALLFGNVNNAVINTGNNLVISSNASGTARVGDLTNNGANSGNTIIGRVTVERYIPGYRSWRLLSVPLKTAGAQTINAAWQEGVVNPDLNYANNLNPNPGYGTHISGSSTALGFDPTGTNNPSVKTYNPTTGAWTGIPNTNSLKVSDSTGYMLFVRGDRSIQLSLNASAPATPTILRASGELKTGTQSISIPATAAPYALVGNPFASAIDLRKLNRTAGLSDGFAIWDPKLGGSSNVGGYQYITRSGTDYTIFPGGGSFGSANSVMNTIQSGQAFMIQHTGAGTLTIAESAKDAGSSNAMFRPTTGEEPGRVSVILHKQESNGSFVVTDGALAVFSNELDNNIDVNDFRKADNIAENLSLLQDGTALAINKRKPVNGSDTLQYRLNRLKLKNYRFEIALNNPEPGTPQAFLEDSYTQSQTPLNMNGSTNYDFVVTMDSGAWNPLRFKIVFKPISTVPVSFTTVAATRQQNNIQVHWATADENGIARYRVERSSNGRNFNSIGEVVATGNGARTGQYQFTDRQPLNGDNFYRIRSIGTAGEEKFSTIVKVTPVAKASGMSIYPNPVTGGEINLMLDNMTRGEYTARIINDLGQVIAIRKIVHQSESSAQRIDLGNMLKAGNYRLEVTNNEQNSRTVIGFISQQ
jgi:subtilisin-like proprotein convertase family protein